MFEEQFFDGIVQKSDVKRLLANRCSCRGILGNLFPHWRGAEVEFFPGFQLRRSLHLVEQRGCGHEFVVKFPGFAIHRFFT